MSELKYSIVIATRNRFDALTASVPMMLNQTPSPSQIILVDSSDNHEAIKEHFLKLIGNFEGELKIINSPRGLTLQRNVGLEHVTNPVVFFPDDDSVWYPNYAAEKLKVYESDASRCISAVCGMESTQSPDAKATDASNYKKTKREKIISKLIRFKRKFENKYFPDPFQSIGKDRIQRSNAIKNAPKLGENVVKVEYMTGFRMSFRTEAIRKHKFDEILKEYGLNEDIDASFSAWNEGIVVAARNARVYHHRSPEKRANGQKLGITSVLNRAYVTAKHSDANSAHRRICLRYLKYALFLCKIQALDSHMKTKAMGMSQALDKAAHILASNKTDLEARYKTALQSLIP